jgi:SM-20-related protein
MTYKKICSDLEEFGLSVSDNFILFESLEKIRADFKYIQSHHGFTRAGVGHKTGLEVRSNIRRDEIHWLDEKLQNPIQKLIWDKLAELKQNINHSLFMGLTEFSGHYANYPIGGFYKRHLDCFQNNNSRLLSVILYLNPNWKTADGGKLRIYNQVSYVDISPIAGTLVCFLSRENEHEVLLNNAIRQSFSGWFTNETLP